MDWRTAGKTIPEISTRDLVVFRLPPEESEQLAHQYNRALSNLNNDGADVAIISLKKIITEYPTWGEPSLLFGICVAQCEEYHRALKCFEHALTCGLHSQAMTELAQYCLAHPKPVTSTTFPRPAAPMATASAACTSWSWRSVVRRRRRLRPNRHRPSPILSRMSLL